MLINHPEGGFLQNPAIDENNIIINSLTDYIQALRDILGDTKREIWYRGQRDAKWRLTSSLYRDKKLTPRNNPDEIRVPTYKLDFIPSDLKEAIDYIENNLAHNQLNFCEKLMLAQHYGIPTPFLDWSTDPLVALWFAIENSTAGSSNAVVWLLDPGYGNTICPGLDLDYPVTTQQANELIEKQIKYFIENNNTDINMLQITEDLPLALYTENEFSPRISRQSGKFTFSGPHSQWGNVRTGGIENYANNKKLWSMSKIVIDSNYLREILEDLRLLGVTEQTIYGDRNMDSKVKAIIEGIKDSKSA